MKRDIELCLAGHLRQELAPSPNGESINLVRPKRRIRQTLACLLGRLEPREHREENNHTVVKVQSLEVRTNKNASHSNCSSGSFHIRRHFHQSLSGEVSGTCIKWSNDIKSWQEARDECKKDKGDLIKVLDGKTNHFLSEFAGYGFNYYWIGLNDIKEEGKFRWLDGDDEVGATFWSFGSSHHRNKDERDCVAMIVSFYGSCKPWYIFKCSLNQPYICEKTPAKTYQDHKEEIQLTNFRKRPQTPHLRCIAQIDSNGRTNRRRDRKSYRSAPSNDFETRDA
ncbi:hypothetical protein RRG08_049142 [Elysia crispata]|uniref:C-type lectin domain-containing protein n=1 Tax=Elysia crispata TaxID=231223 RepID=A0AAE0YL66_9GAST|nr:hypothetical protein RRG08_049142 [Elysia crispata]